MITHRTWVEVRVDQIADNLREIRSTIRSGCKILAAIKGNACGLDTVQFARCITSLGIEWLGVANIADGLAIRSASVDQPLLLLAEAIAGPIEEAIAQKISFSVGSLAMADRLAAAAANCGETAIVHVKVNTGLNRYGVAPESFVTFLRALNAMPNIKLEGAYTHYSSSNLADRSPTERQRQRFLQAVSQAEAAGFRLPFIHASNTASTLRSQSIESSLVRIGVGLQGLLPSTKLASIARLTYPATWRSHIAAIQNVPAGARVGYGEGYQVFERTRIGIVPVGYGDGLHKSLAGRSGFLVRGQRAAVLAITMDQSLVDLGPEAVASVGDDVVVLGGEGPEAKLLRELDDIREGFAIEQCCQINPRIPRFYVP